MEDEYRYASPLKRYLAVGLCAVLVVLSVVLACVFVSFYITEREFGWLMMAALIGSNGLSPVRWAYKAWHRW